MAQHHAPGLAPLAEFDRHRQMRMGRMRFAPQTIADENVDLVEQVDHFVGNCTEIRGIGNAFPIGFEAIGGRLARTMRHLAPVHAEPGNHPQPVERVERADRRVAFLSGEDIAEALPQPPDGLSLGKSRDRPRAPVAQHAQIIDAVAVIGVIVRPEHRVDMADPVRQQLRAAIGGGVD